MTCVFIGDSLAVGMAQHRPMCVNQAVVGRTTSQTVAHVRQVPANSQQVIISVGSNDRLDRSTPLRVWIDKFSSLRTAVRAQIVVWILPNTSDLAREAIAIVAREHGDCVLDSHPTVGADGVHPTAAGYRNLARASENIQKSNSCAAK